MTSVAGSGAGPATADLPHAPIPPLSVGGVLVLALGALDFGLEQSIVVPALPVLAEHYGASIASVGWLITGFLLAGIVAVPLLGRLGDLFGKRRLLLVALSAFGVGSLICALADSVGFVIAGRVVQGLGMAVGPLTFALARDIVAPERFPRAVGAVVGAASAGVTVGFLLSGLLVDHVSVTSIFWFLFVLAVALIIATVALVPESPVSARVPIDFVGAVILSAGLAVLLLAISKGNDWGWRSASILWLFAASLVALSVFMLVERRVRQPLIDLGLVVSRPFANANVCVFAFGFAFYLAGVVVPIIASLPKASGYGLGFTTTEIGLMLLPSGLAAIVSAWLGGRWVDRVGPRALTTAGSILGIAAYLSFTLTHSSVAALTAANTVLGFSWGLVLTGIYPVVVRSSSIDKTGVAVAINVLTRNTALAVGVQLSFALLTGAGTTADGFPAESGFTRTFVMGLIGAGLTLGASTLMPGRDAPKGGGSASAEPPPVR